MIAIINSILSFISSNLSLLTAETIALIIKLCLLGNLALYAIRHYKVPKPLFFLFLVLIGSLIEDLSWIVSLSNVLFFPSMDYRIRIFFIRFAWAFEIIQYQSLAFFIESLTEKNFYLKFRQKFFLIISSIYTFAFLYLAFISSWTTYSINDRSALEFQMLGQVNIYAFIIIIPSLCASLIKLKNKNIPKILKKQLKILILGLICPRIITDFIQVYPFNIITCLLSGLATSHYSVISISTLLVAYSAYYCTRKVLGLRFLNLKKHVQSTKKFNFINNFKDILRQLSQVTSIQELIFITKTFFKDDLQIPIARTALYIRNLEDNHNNYYQNTEQDNSIVENFINNHKSNTEIVELIKTSKILIYDEIEFSNFYEENDTSKIILNFLNSINADIFVPIYKKQTIIAYIIIEKDHKSNQIYNNIERDEIVVFSNYIGNIINLLQNRNLELLIQQEKEFKEELYNKHQEINQYKESIRSFLKKTEHRKIGILFYKNRSFIFVNQDAKELIPININTQDGHSLTQDLKKITKEVEEYKSQQIYYSNDLEGNKIILKGIPNLEYNYVIVMVYYPDISDIIKNQIDLLKDPSKWDYLLYLETTKSGQLINQLIPGSAETLLNFKVNLLKMALTKKAIFLEIPDDDLMATVEIIHHISLRENLHILKLNSPSRNLEIGIKLFGINNIYNNNHDTQCILQKLNSNGTLFIQNIHFLDIETQDHLAKFIKYGFYYILKSDKKISSDVRIICSSNQNISNLVKENKFSKLLYEEINKSSLSMPSLLTLSNQELSTLAHGFSKQAIQSNEFKNLLELTDKEKISIINKKPVSLQEFKTKIQQILVEKSKKNNVYQETQFDPGFNITDPKLIEAARLGKHALKDPKIVALLWDKFKNQNKIATFLGVNRSSVHRRCKEYNIY